MKSSKQLFQEWLIKIYSEGYSEDDSVARAMNIVEKNAKEREKFIVQL